MGFCIFHGNFFQNCFPGSAHILQVEFLTVQYYPSLCQPSGHNGAGKAQFPVERRLALAEDRGDRDCGAAAEGHEEDPIHVVDLCEENRCYSLGNNLKWDFQETLKWDSARECFGF